MKSLQKKRNNILEKAHFAQITKCNFHKVTVLYLIKLKLNFYFYFYFSFSPFSEIDIKTETATQLKSISTNNPIKIPKTVEEIKVESLATFSCLLIERITKTERTINPTAEIKVSPIKTETIFGMIDSLKFEFELI